MTPDPAITANHAWTGSRYVDVTRPRPEDIVLHEIAVGLAREQRYGGAATSQFWSVAQHCLLALHLAPAGRETSFYATLLMHDAPEYMLRDLIRPVKINCAEYRIIEERWWWAIADRFGLPLTIPPEVKHYDDMALACEKRNLISRDCGPWPGIPEATVAIPGDILRLTPDEAAWRFLHTAARLLGERL